MHAHAALSHSGPRAARRTHLLPHICLQSRTPSGADGMTEAASDGWLLHLSGGLRAAIGLRQMLYILPDQPATHAVPRAPVHATRIFVWQQHLVPLIDLHAYLSGSKAQPGADASSWQPMVGVVGCATGSEAEDSAAQGAALGALMLSRAPD